MTAPIQRRIPTTQATTQPNQESTHRVRQPQRKASSKPQAAEATQSAQAPLICPAHVNIPKKLADRFALALQSQAMPWAQGEAVILGLYAETCEFRDPVMHFNSRAGFIKYLKFMDDYGKVPRVDIAESHMEGNVGHASGTLYYQPKVGPTIRADFTTRMEFNDQGLIVKHEDKWNVLGSLISALLGRGKLPAEA